MNMNLNKENLSNNEGVKLQMTKEQIVNLVKKGETKSFLNSIANNIMEDDRSKFLFLLFFLIFF